MVRSRVYGTLAGYADQNDHATHRADPVFECPPFLSLRLRVLLDRRWGAGEAGQVGMGPAGAA
jgi:hypothetical protein